MQNMPGKKKKKKSSRLHWEIIPFLISENIVWHFIKK